MELILTTKDDNHNPSITFTINKQGIDVKVDGADPDIHIDFGTSNTEQQLSCNVNNNTLVEVKQQVSGVLSKKEECIYLHNTKTNITSIADAEKILTQKLLPASATYSKTVPIDQITTQLLTKNPELNNFITNNKDLLIALYTQKHKASPTPNQNLKLITTSNHIFKT